MDSNAMLSIPWSWSTVATTIAVLWFLSFIILTKKKSQQLPPGPKGFPLVGNLLSLDPELHTYFSTLANTYGSIFTLKLGQKIGIVISSPSYAKEVLKDLDTTFANRDVPVAGREAAYGGSDIVWNPYGPEWRMLRKVCVREMLSHKTLDSVYSLRRRELRRTIKHLYYNKQGMPVNIGEQMFSTVMNVITSMLWGGTVQANESEAGAAEFKEVVGEMTALLGMPNLSDFYPGLSRFDLQGIQKKMKGLAKRFDGIFEAMIRERLHHQGFGDCAKENNNKDFLQFLLKMKDEGGDDDKTTLTITHVKALLMDMIVGGTDTTSNTIEFALAEMMNKPDVIKRAQEELQEVIGEDNIVEETDINKLPYLHAVMKEVLRLHPALPLLVPHCPSATCKVAGYTIPKGARVFINVWAIHRDPSIWTNPLDFCPERFLDGKWDYTGNDFNYFPFGSGRRICAGISMAERMFMYSLATLVHSFEWKLPAGQNLELSEKFGIVLKKRAPLIAIPTPRFSNASLYE